MLRICVLVWIALAWAVAAPARAQEGDALETIELRVTSSKPGLATIDRGSNDGLEIGDRVQFFPRQGFIYAGRVARVTERSADVELDDRAFAPPPGTRGEARVPKSRFAEPVVPAEEATEEMDATEAAPEHPPWENQDEDWRAGDPLLAKVRPLRPKERPRSVHGRAYSIVDQIFSSEDNREDGFYRLGTSFEVDNVTGRGDRLNADGELNYRYTDVPDDDDESATRFRLDRLSYSFGGDRFEPSSFELGRFLQRGMPEFGVLDGIEWSTRTSRGNRFGFSTGYMPEPDSQQDTGDDYQFGAWYRWVKDESEILSASAGYQKTFHEWDADRDLVIANFQYLPPNRWNYNATAWVDFYTSSDSAKGAGAELTQVYANAYRRFQSGSTASFTYTHLAFPEIDRNEFRPVTDEQLADDHNDRIAFSGTKRLARRTRLYTTIGGWSDEDEDGGDGEFGIGVDDLIMDQSQVDISVFGSRARYTSTFGTRAGFDVYTRGGRWAFDYEFAKNQLDGFAADNDDLPQHRARITRDVSTDSGWDFSAYVEGQFWDSEAAALLGVYLQRSF